MTIVVSSFAGRSSRSTFRVVGYSSGRSAALLADAEAPAACAVQAYHDLTRPAGTGHLAVGRQLRASVRLHLWLPSGLRTYAVHLVRPLRS